MAIFYEVSGTMVGAEPGDIRDGTTTLILTLTDGIWAVTCCCLFNNQRQGIIDNITGDFSGGCATTVAIASVSGGTAAATSITICAPCGVSCGDLLIAAFTKGDNNPTQSGCSLFTSLAGSDLNIGQPRIWYRFAGASEPCTYRFEKSAGGVIRWALTIWRLTGACVTCAPAAGCVVSEANTSTPNPGVSPTAATAGNHAIIAFSGISQGGGTCAGYVASTNYTKEAFITTGSGFGHLTLLGESRILCNGTNDDPGVWQCGDWPCTRNPGSFTLTVLAEGTCGGWCAQVSIPVGCVVRTSDTVVTITVPQSSGYRPGCTTQGGTDDIVGGGENLAIDILPAAAWPLIDHRIIPKKGVGWYPFLPSIPSNLPYSHGAIYNDPNHIVYAWPGQWRFEQSIGFLWRANYIIGNRWVVPFAGSGLGIRLFTTAGSVTYGSKEFQALGATPEHASDSFDTLRSTVISAATIIHLQGDGTGPVAFWTFAAEHVGDTNNRIYAINPPDIDIPCAVDCFPTYVGKIIPTVTLAQLCIDAYTGAFKNKNGTPIDICLNLFLTEWREKIETNAIVLGIGLYKTLAFALNYAKIIIRVKGVVSGQPHAAHPLSHGVPHTPDMTDLEEASLLFNEIGVSKHKARLRLPLVTGYRDYEGVIESIAITTPAGSTKQEYTLNFQVDWNPAFPQLRGWNNE